MLNKHNYFGYGIWFCYEEVFFECFAVFICLFPPEEGKMEFLFVLISKIDWINLKLDEIRHSLCLKSNQFEKNFHYVALTALAKHYDANFREGICNGRRQTFYHHPLCIVHRKCSFPLKQNKRQKFHLAIDISSGVIERISQITCKRFSFNNRSSQQWKKNSFLSKKNKELERLKGIDIKSSMHDEE